MMKCNLNLSFYIVWQQTDYYSLPAYCVAWQFWGVAITKYADGTLRTVKEAFF